MAKQLPSLGAESAGFACYRITADGRAAMVHEHPQVRSRYLVDILVLLNTSGSGVKECYLRQFMPPASLGESLDTLLQLGLIECR